MGSNTSAFFVGVIVAVLSFILNGILTHIVRGVRFRRKLCADIALTVDGYSSHSPDLENLKEKASGEVSSVSFIWDNETQAVDDLAEKRQYLKALEFSQCARFYDELSLIGEIRHEYNLAVRGAIIDPEKTARYEVIVLACIGDLQKQYKQVIRRGCQCLLELKKNHSFLETDAARYQEMLNQHAE